jgi:hypothetical protein
MLLPTKKITENGIFDITFYRNKIESCAFHRYKEEIQKNQSVYDKFFYICFPRLFRSVFQKTIVKKHVFLTREKPKKCFFWYSVKSPKKHHKKQNFKKRNSRKITIPKNRYFEKNIIKKSKSRKKNFRN